MPLRVVAGKAERALSSCCADELGWTRAGSEHLGQLVSLLVWRPRPTGMALATCVLGTFGSWTPSSAGVYF